MTVFSKDWPERAAKIYGFVSAIVTNNKDPDGLYRVKVRYPWLPNGGAQGGEESGWARIVGLGGGSQRGFFFLPEVGDEVLVAFEHGEFGRPIVVGGLWNSDSTSTRQSDEKNDVRAIKTRSGHTVEFGDDKKGKKESVQIQAKSGAKIRIDEASGGEKIEIADDGSDNVIVVDMAGKKVTVESKSGDLLIKGKGKLQLEAETIEVKTSKQTKMTVGGKLTMEAKGNFQIKGQQTQLESSGDMTIKAPTCVDINPTTGGGGGGGAAGAPIGQAPKTSRSGGSASGQGAESDSAARDLSSSSATSGQGESQTDEEETTHWIEFELVDADGNPIADEEYELTKPDGGKKKGKTDASGKVREENLTLGMCEIKFPKLAKNPNARS